MSRKNTLGFALALALVAMPAMAADLTVDQIIEKNIEARGGADAWKAFDSAELEITMSMPAMGMEAPVTVQWKRPNKVRMDTVIQGMTMTQAYDGETGWGIMPMMGKPDPETLAEDQLKQLRDQSEIEGPLIGYKDKGHEVELLGTEEVDGTNTYKLKVTKKSGDIVTLFIDTEYFLEIRMDSLVDMQGTEVTGTTMLSDYKEVGGLMMPHAMEMSMGGGPAMMTMTIAAMNLDVPVDDKRFMMPEKTEKAEKPSE